MATVNGKARGGLKPGVRDLVTELLGVWLLLAVFLDGWAHLNLPSLETFFTPWHAALYSGMVATALWTASVIWRNRAPGQPLSQAAPPGYRGTAIGVVLFGVAGGLDLLWHEILGIEVSLDALVSPTHLLLGFSLFLILGTAVRSARAAGRDANFEWTPAALFAVVLMTGLGAFFLIYVSAFVRPGPTALFTPTPVGTPGRIQAELPVVITLASYLLTTALIIAPFLFTLTAAGRSHRGRGEDGCRPRPDERGDVDEEERSEPRHENDGEQRRRGQRKVSGVAGGAVAGCAVADGAVADGAVAGCAGAADSGAQD